MNRSLLSGLWLCLFLSANVLSGLDQAEPGLGRDPLMELQKEGWKILQDGVLRRELKPKEIETFVFGEAGFSWKLWDLRAQLQVLRREFQAYPTPELRRAIASHRKLIASTLKMIERARAADASRESTVLKTGCTPTFVYSANASYKTDRQGTWADAVAGFDVFAGCTASGEVYAYAFAKTTVNGAPSTATVTDGPRSGGNVNASADANRNGGAPCESYAYASVTSDSLSPTSYSISQTNDRCPAVVRQLMQAGPGQIGKDIWTTSVYSYVPGRLTPGGGLDDDRLRVGGWGDFYYSLIEFDLTGLPQQAQTARIELFPRPHEGAAGATDMYLDRITTFWDWRTQGTGTDRERLWWADRPAAVQWQASTLPAPTLGQWYSIDITGLYNAWQAGTYPNYGIQLRPVLTNNTWAVFYSANSADQALRPRLVIEPAAPSQDHPMVGVWRGTVAGYASELTIQQAGGVFTARLSMDQANDPVEDVEIRALSETALTIYRPADDAILQVTRTGTPECLTGEYLEPGSSRPISLCKVP